MYIIRKRLFEREGAPPDTRYNPDTDTVETSTDGGVTWNPNTGADPRKNDAYLMPPNDAPDPKCAAAAGMVEYVRQAVQAGIDGTTIAGVGNVFLSILLVFLPISWLFALIAIAAEAVIAIGGAALSFAFSEGIYSQIQCIFLEFVEDDGRITAEGLENVELAVDAIGDTVVTTVFALMVQMAGHVGFSNAGVKFADPDAVCVCGNCYEVDYSGGEPVGSVAHLFFGNFDTDHYTQACIGGAGSTSSLNVSRQYSTTACTWQRVEADIEALVVPTNWYIYGMNDSDPSTGDLTLLGSGTSGVGFETVGVDIADEPYYGVRVILDTPEGCGTGDAYLWATRICSDNLSLAGLSANCELCE